MKRLYLKHNLTTGLTEINGVPAANLEVNVGDDVLVCATFVESLPDATVETAVNLTDPATPLGLRFVVESARNAAATALTLRDVYNEGLWADESLAGGKVSWLVNFGTAALETAIDESEQIAIWAEVDLLTSANYRQTLLQIPVTLTAELNDWGAGTPIPSTPTYDTAATILATYALVPTTVALSATGSLSSANRQVNYLSTGANTYTLPALSGIDDGYRPVIIKNDAATTITVDTTGADTINGAASVTLATQYAALAFVPDVANGNWLLLTYAT